MNRRLILVGFIGAAVMVFTVWVAALINQDPDVSYASPADFIRRIVVNGAFVFVGCVLWARRPDNRIGPLLVIYAFAWIIGGNLAPAAGENLPLWAGHITSAVSALYGIPLVWLIVSFPTGKLVRGIDRAAVGLVALDATVQGAMRVIGYYIESAGRFWSRYYPVPNGVVALFVLCIVVIRLRRASPVERRGLTPVWVASGTLALIFIASGIQTLAIALTSKQAYALASSLDYASMLIPIAYGTGLLRLRSRRAGVGKLIIELSDQPAPGKLREALVRTLGDPSLELAFWFPDAQSYVDLDGKPFHVPDQDPARAITVLERGGERLAAIVFDATLAEAPELVASVGAAASLALDNERLHAAVRAQLEEVRASRQRIIEAADDERRRVERNIHDGAQQRLMALSLALRRAQRKVADDVGAAEAIIAEAAAELSIAVSELRELARGIHPPILTDDGLGPALQALVDRSSPPARLAIDPIGRLTPAVEVTAYYMATEALTNAARYANASEVSIDVHRDEEVLIVEIRDDGPGGADPSKGSGLRGLADRVAAVGGHLHVDSPPGGGTRLTATLPCA